MNLNFFWGGDAITFKILDKKKEWKRGNDLEDRRRNAEVISASNQKVFKIDISKFEFCSV